MDTATVRHAGTDEELQRIVGEIGAGNRAAERDLVQRFQQGIVLLARRHARPNESRVYDVAQNVLTAVIERLRQGGLHDAQALPAYVRTCVLREVAALYSGPEIQSSDATRDGSTLLVACDTPENKVAQQQLLGRVARAIDSLPVTRDRELLIRFYAQEQSRDEICAVLGIDQSHFRRVLFRARARLLAVIGQIT